MKTSVRMPVGAGLAALLLAAGAVGCSKEDEAGESPEMTPAAAVAEAAKKTEEIDSFSYRMTGQAPEEGRVEAEAQMRIEPTLAMSMKMTALDQGADAKAEIRIVDKAMYIGGGAAAAKEMDGKSWMKFDLAAMGAGDELNQLGGASQADKNPATESTFLTGAKDVEKVGTETVDGVETTHYKGTVALADLEKSLADEDKATQEKRQKSIEQYEKMGIDKLTMDMWVDGDDQTKQFRMRGDADKGPLDMTITFLGINEPVKVTAPPAKDTVDLAEMMKEAQQG
ncbi:MULTISPECIES: LppX_LprAFG lipoprotein [unclassified Streptomyces]|uniref:LppX_LprAFG lipoprotein n=1 Tax=unclassified Streptomyces TaxID=2593676 RepID=UPI00234B3C4C|nr:LppX_LprAFG lipoprotein [Streptomyces sp. M92]WCN02668.1 LppX_LprAFG lipoprotein [Streptomyces sp. M92]